ncbi:MAG: GtrA family protein [Candidatus Zixiibacteriota bacterium]
MNTRIYSIIHQKEVKRIVKFGLVGTWGFVVNMFFLWFFTETMGLFYLFSSLIAIEMSLINNYVFNDLWTWHDRGKEGKREYLKRMLQYHATASAAMLANIAILWVLTELFDVYYLASNVFGILCGAVLNFFLNDRWTFKHKKEIAKP